MITLCLGTLRFDAKAAKSKDGLLTMVDSGEGDVK